MSTQHFVDHKTMSTVIFTRALRDLPTFCISILKHSILTLFVFIFAVIDWSGAEAFQSPLDPDQVSQIDQSIENRLRAIGAKANPVASQEVLLRRLHLQVIGRNPRCGSSRITSG
jgi:hypothetical protein